MADTEPNDSPARRSRTPILIGAAVVLVIIIAVGAFVWFRFLKDDSDPELAIKDSETGSGQVVDAATLDGTYQVIPGTGGDATVAGYRVKEEFAAGARKVTANGRTNDVTGSLTAAGGKVTAAEFIVDLTTLKSDEDRRDQVIKGDGLETDQFPKGIFTLTEPITLPEVQDGKVFEATAKGELDLHGVRKAVEVPIEAKVTKGTVTVQGLVDIEMADYEINPPSRPGFVEVSDDGSFEFLISLERGGA